MNGFSPWSWLIAGIVLMLMELLTPGFVVFFFGLAAATVALCIWLFPGFGAYWQLAAFSVFSILYLVVLRRYVKSVFMGDVESNAVADDLVGRVGKVTELIRPEVPGRVQVRDAEWTAKADVRLEPGDEVKVVAHDNLTIAVEKLS